MKDHLKEDGHRLWWCVEDHEIIDIELIHPDICSKEKRENLSKNWYEIYTCDIGFEHDEIGLHDEHTFPDQYQYMTDHPDGVYEEPIKWYFNSWTNYWGEYEVEFDWDFVEKWDV